MSDIKNPRHELVHGHAMDEESKLSWDSERRGIETVRMALSIKHWLACIRVVFTGIFATHKAWRGASGITVAIAAPFQMSQKQLFLT